MARARILPLTLTLTLAAALLAASGHLIAGAQEAKKSTKGGTKYEEHYEAVPADIEPGSGPSPAAGHLDPEGDTSPAAAPAPRAPAASHKGPFTVAPSSTSSRKAPVEPPPPVTAYPEPERAGTPEPPATREAPVRERPAHAAKRMEMPEAPEARESVPDRKRARPTLTQPGDEAGGEIPALAYFYDAVTEGGEWVNNPRFGRVFAPKVGDGWRPYTLGRWAYSDDYGWVWVSDEPFGWATYHYGRWTLDSDKGWIWVPGVEWGPSWVIWRQGEDAIGWAPLPPSAQFTGKGLTVDAEAIESSRFEDAWVFVDPRYFGQPAMRRYLRSARWNADLVPRTAARVGYQRDNDRIANRGIAAEDIEKLAGRPVQRAKITLADETRLKREGGSREGGDIKLYRPDAKRLEDVARTAGKKRPRGEDGRDSDTESEQARIRDGERDTSKPVKIESDFAVKPRKPAAPKIVTKFSPAVLQRVETENGVTELWVTPAPAPPVASEEPAQAAGGKTETKPADRKKEAKFSPITSQRTETDSAVTESWASPAPAKDATGKDAAGEKRSASSKPKTEPATGEGTPSVRKSAARAEPAIERAQGSRYENYSVPNPDVTGDSPTDPAAPTKKATAAQGDAGARTDTGSVSRAKRRWDGSGTSGAPAAVPGAVQ